MPDAEQQLLDTFDVANTAELRLKRDDDVFPATLPYHSPVSDAIFDAFDWACDGKADSDHWTLTKPGFFADKNDVASVGEFDWPDPNEYVSPDECRRLVDEVPMDRAALGCVWSAHFQDACAAFGMETALIKLLTEPDLFQAVIDRIVEFYLEANRIFYEATADRLDAILIGNDFGSQAGLLLSREQIRKAVLPGTRRLVAQAKQYGLKVIHHSCGAIRELIPDLIECGVDVIHPIQALAEGMEPEGLRDDFGDRVSFCGGVDAQHLLVEGLPDEVRREVRRLKQLFPTGLVISPSHEVVLPEIPPENIGAMCEAVCEP